MLSLGSERKKGKLFFMANDYMKRRHYHLIC